MYQSVGSVVSVQYSSTVLTLLFAVRQQTETTAPADILLVHGSCIVNEAMLSGESTPLVKESIELLEGSDKLDVDVTHKNQVLFSGTKVLQARSGGGCLFGLILLSLFSSRLHRRYSRRWMSRCRSSHRIWNSPRTARPYDDLLDRTNFREQRGVVPIHRFPSYLRYRCKLVRLG